VKQEIYRVAERHALKAPSSKSSSPPTPPPRCRAIFLLAGGRTHGWGPTFAGDPLIERMVVGA